MRITILSSLLALSLTSAQSACNNNAGTGHDALTDKDTCVMTGHDSIPRPIMRTDIHYTSEDSAWICRQLKESETITEHAALPLFFARKFIGRPYVAHTLEVLDNEKLIVNTTQLDCTTLVENVAAMTICARKRLCTFNDFAEVLRSLRYRNGQLDGYTSRLHYFSDWIDNKEEMGLTTCIQTEQPPFTAIQKLNTDYMSTHSQSYKALAAHPEYVHEIRQTEKALTGKTYRYIPKGSVTNTQLMRKTVKDGDIIAITCNKKGLDIAHLGFAVWRNDGLHLLNASMIHKKVVEEPLTLYKYLQRHPSHTGIRIIRIN